MRQGGRRGRRRCTAFVAVIILAAPIAVLDAVLTATGAGAEVVLTNFPLKTVPDDITAGPDGALWFTTIPFTGHYGAIQRMTTGGVVTATYTNAKIRSPHSIATGSDGALWFIDGEGDSGPIGRITTAGVVTTFTDATLARPRHLTLGPDGALWFTNGGTFVNGVPTADKGSIGRIAPDGTISNYRAPSILFPGLITAGPDGALWFTNTGGAGGGDHGSIGRITTSGTVTNFASPDIQYPSWITAGSDGALWFPNTGDGHGGSIGRITTTGTVTRYGQFAPSVLVAGPDGALYGESGNGYVRVTTDGQIGGGTFVQSIFPRKWTTGSDGALWFTNHGPAGRGGIGRLTTSLTPAEPTGATASPQSGRADVTWSAPIDNGSPAPTGYEVIPYVKGVPQAPRMFSGAATSASITGLTNGTSYQFIVAGLNANGTGAFSDRTYPVNVGSPSPWKIVDSPTPSGPGGTVGQLSGVACMTATTCFAAGLDGSSGNPEPLIERWDGSSWSIVPSATPSTGVGQLAEVACAGTKTCFAVGDSGISFSRTVLERWDGSKFVNAGPNLPGVLTDVACSSATNCFAVGVRYSPAHELIERWNGSKWTQLTGTNAIAHRSPRAISCPTKTSCVVVDALGAVQRWNGSAWSAWTTPPNFPTDSYINALSCPDATTCMAAGAGDGSSHGVVAKWNGTQWKALPTPTVADVDGSVLADVTCTSKTSCFAVGYNAFTYGDGTHTLGGTLIEKWNGAKWSLVRTPNPSGLGVLEGVVCPSATHCTAVGYGNPSSTLVLRA
jgi:virginiamycin B lyase